MLRPLLRFSTFAADVRVSGLPGGQLEPFVAFGAGLSHVASVAQFRPGVPFLPLHYLAPFLLKPENERIAFASYKQPTETHALPIPDIDDLGARALRLRLGERMMGSISDRKRKAA